MERSLPFAALLVLSVLAVVFLFAVNLLTPWRWTTRGRFMWYFGNTDPLYLSGSGSEGVRADIRNQMRYLAERAGYAAIAQEAADRWQCRPRTDLLGRKQLRRSVDQAKRDWAGAMEALKHYDPEFARTIPHWSRQDPYISWRVEQVVRPRQTH